MRDVTHKEDAVGCRLSVVGSELHDVVQEAELPE